MPLIAPASETPSTGTVRHFDFIDALRGWAFLGVLVTHVSNLATPGRFLSHLTWRGPFGVQLFFVISALTLFLSMQSRWKKDKHPVAAFFVRRFFRIAPMFWLALAFYVVAWGMKGGYWAPDGLTPSMIAATAAFVHGWRPEYINSVVPGGWSIAVEMNFYLLLPLLFLGIRSLRQAVVFWVCSLVVAVTLQHWMLHIYAPHYPASQLYLVRSFLYLWLPSQLPVFGAGIIAYFLLKDKLKGGASGEKSPKLPHPAIFLAGALFFGSFVTTVVKSSWMPTQVLFAICFGLLACGLAFWPVSLIVNPLMRYAGKVSYSAYLTHFALLGPSDFLLTHLHGPFRHESAPYFLLLVALVFVLTLAVSTITYHLVEMPGQAVGKRVIRFLDETLGSPRAASEPTFVKPENEPVA